MNQIQDLGPENITPFLALPACVLILSKSDCAACKKWQKELDEWLSQNDGECSLPIGKLNLDQRGLGDFKKNHTWIQEVTDLPFNAIVRDGEILKKFAGSGVDRLLNRLRRVELLPPSD